jgi:hypothetical protein
MNSTDHTLNPQTFLDSFRDSLAPVLQVQQESLKVVDRVARYQYAVAGDYLEWSLAQSRVPLVAHSPADLLAQQAELGIKFSEQLRSRIQELTKIRSEGQTTFSPPHQKFIAPVATTTIPVALPEVEITVPVAKPTAKVVNLMAAAVRAAPPVVETALPGTTAVAPVIRVPAPAVNSPVPVVQAVAVKPATSPSHAPTAEPRAQLSASPKGAQPPSPSSTAPRAHVAAPTAVAPVPILKGSPASVKSSPQHAKADAGRPSEESQRFRGAAPGNSHSASKGRSPAPGWMNRDSGKSKTRKKT